MTASPADERGSRAPLLWPWRRAYQRAWLASDAFAAVMLLVIAVPEQLATSRLAGMPPVAGLYAFVAGTVLFAVLGSNPQLSVGADSTIAPLFAVGIAHLAPTGSKDYVALVSLLAVVVGVLVALVGVLRLGWVAEFLSLPIVTGFLAGVAVIIVVHQLPDLLGLPAVSGTTLHRLRVIAGHLGHVNGWTLGIGVVVLGIVLAAERIDKKVPGALIGLVGSTVVVRVAGLRDHGVAVLGTLSHGAPRFGLHDVSWSSLGEVLPIAAVVALVVLSQSAATTRAFADQGGYDVDVTRDFLGVGAGNIVSGLAGSFAVNASPARTAVVAGAGGRTQVATLGAAAAVVALVPAAGLLTDVPLATLAAVLIFVATRIFRIHQLEAVRRFDLFEFALALVTLLAVAFVGVEQGIGVAVGLAILDRTRISARPQSYVLGRIPGTTSWEALGHHEHPEEVPGVVVFQFLAPLYYANAAHFRAEAHRALGRALTPPKLFVLDADAMTDIDFTGTRALRTFLDEVDRAHIAFVMARVVGTTPRNLARGALLDRIGRDHLFHTIDGAVTALAPGPGGTGA